MLRSNFSVPETVVLADDASLTEQGIVDSTGMLQVIQFLEREMQVSLDTNRAPRLASRSASTRRKPVHPSK